MNNRIEKLAEQSLFDVDQILAEIICPDYDGPETHKLVVAWNAMPKEIRLGIVELIKKRQEQFAQLIIDDCINRAEREWIRNGDTEHNRAIHSVIESITHHFGIES